MKCDKKEGVNVSAEVDTWKISMRQLLAGGCLLNGRGSECCLLIGDK